jgi:hypothetical protein
MKRIVVTLLLFTLTWTSPAQESKPKANESGEEKNDDSPSALERAVALGDRFRLFHDPVVAAFALSQLGGLVCSQDRVAGTDLFRDSLYRLRALTPQSFTSAEHRLPVPSFTLLWNSVIPKAIKCAADLADLTDTERAKAKMQEERQQANDDVRNAFSLVKSNPDRAAQLVETALSVSDPTVLDIPSVTFFLSQLRDRAPDVSDDLFPEVLDFISSTKQPSPALLLQLGVYLFTASQYRERPDVLQDSDSRQVGSTSIPIFTVNRKSASSDDIHDYIDAAVKVLSATNDPYYDPVAAYAIAFQLLPRVDDYAPELSDKLRNALALVTEQAGAAAAQVQAAVAGNGTADAEGGEGARNRDRLVGQVLAMASSKRFAEAHEMAQKIDDSSVSSQVRSLTDFAESTAALDKKDAQWAFTLANTLRGGVKRALLYAGMTVAARDQVDALGYFGLGIRDTDLLPAEQRMVTTTALMSAILPRDLENGFLALSLFVKAANDAYTSPHQGRFEPDIVRKVYSQTASAFTDSALILANNRCLCEVVDTARGRHSFGLKVPGVQAFGLPMVMQTLSGSDAERTEGIFAGIRDENLQSSQMIALAALRLKR